MQTICFNDFRKLFAPKPSVKIFHRLFEPEKKMNNFWMNWKNVPIASETHPTAWTPTKFSECAVWDKNSKYTFFFYSCLKTKILSSHICWIILARPTNISTLLKYFFSFFKISWKWLNKFWLNIFLLRTSPNKSIFLKPF